ncbi:uncharacterized protein YprB with RNaseH-like and TPR domain [Metabacillus malikii]|uniref:Uncharacterized protein YprB with RNaseH-like and TPR domain n=2 Tax=Metabacillus malikii TaxID=1504265 RepID=A0ABT9Z972_9BACI|nr:uncharacterized protein YprB with RNaseH-like and TPR domain [Metabacillus malikii]
MKKHMVKEEEQSSSQNNFPSDKKVDWEKYQTTIFSYEKQYCFIREVTYPLEYQHGLYKLSDIHRVVAMWNNSNSTHPLSCKGHVASDLFFFDTETTGLGGGVGNTIFLLGQAQVFHDRVVVKQYLLPGPGNEVALYQSFLQDINSKTLVTYNGKAFDWPQVKTRHTLLRESVPKLPAFGHFDLFHASRRLWKQELDSVKLANVEKEILGIKRKDDIPGYLAPMIYFQFVKDNQPDIIEGVLKHNEIDVLSLITLYIHLSLKLLNVDNEASEDEHYQIARWLDYIGDNNSAISAYHSLMDKGNHHEVNSKFQLAYHYKKRKEWKMATMYWIEVINAANDDILMINAAIELAKYYEHQEKNYVQAIYYTKIACDQLMCNNTEDTKHKYLSDIEKRLERLKRKSS